MLIVANVTLTFRILKETNSDLIYRKYNSVYYNTNINVENLLDQKVKNYM